MNKLYHLAWSYDDPNREPEWTFFVSDKPYIATDEELEIIREFMSETMGEEPEDYEIENSWCHEVKVAGYDIRLEKSK